MSLLLCHLDILKVGKQRPWKPYAFIGFVALNVTKPCNSEWFGDMHGPKTFKFIGFSTSACQFTYSSTCPTSIKRFPKSERVALLGWGSGPGSRAISRILNFRLFNRASGPHLFQWILRHEWAVWTP